MAIVTIDCSYCYNKTTVEYERDEDGEWDGDTVEYGNDSEAGYQHEDEDGDRYPEI